MSTQANLLVIRSHDIERAVHFYQQLGLQFCRHAHGSGPEHFACDFGSFVFEIYPARDPDDSTSAVRIGFCVDDIEQAVVRLKEIGAQVVSPLKESEWGRRAVVEDLDGHTIELVANPVRFDVG